jgi:hypothetical protein
MIDSKKLGGSRIGLLTDQLIIEDKNRVQRTVENRMELMITVIKRFSSQQEPSLSQLQEPGMQEGHDAKHDHRAAQQDEARLAAKTDQHRCGESDRSTGDACCGNPERRNRTQRRNTFKSMNWGSHDFTFCPTLSEGSVDVPIVPPLPLTLSQKRHKAPAPRHGDLQWFFGPSGRLDHTIREQAQILCHSHPNHFHYAESVRR